MEFQTRKYITMGGDHFFNFSYFCLLISTQLIWFHLSHRSHWTESSLSLISNLLTLQGYCSIIESRQVNIQAVFNSKRKKNKIKYKQTKKTNNNNNNKFCTMQYKEFKLVQVCFEKSPSSAYLVYLVMYVSSVFVLGICC